LTGVAKNRGHLTGGGGRLTVHHFIDVQRCDKCDA